jgi:hypothetical protein
MDLRLTLGTLQIQLEHWFCHRQLSHYTQSRTFFYLSYVLEIVHYYDVCPFTIKKEKMVRIRVMVLNATFINISVISWRSVLFVAETGVSGENKNSNSQLKSWNNPNPNHLLFLLDYFDKLYLLDFARSNLR